MCFGCVENFLEDSETTPLFNENETFYKHFDVKKDLCFCNFSLCFSRFHQYLAIVASYDYHSFFRVSSYAWETCPIHIKWILNVIKHFYGSELSLKSTFPSKTLIFQQKLRAKKSQKMIFSLKRKVVSECSKIFLHIQNTFSGYLKCCMRLVLNGNET